MDAPKEAHKHVYDKRKLKRITRVQSKYKGSSGDKAFLMAVCSCNKELAYDYGSFELMKEKAGIR